MSPSRSLLTALFLYVSLPTLYAATATTSSASALKTGYIDDKSLGIRLDQPPACTTCRWLSMNVHASEGISETCITINDCQSRDIDYSQLRNGTWTEGSDRVTASFNFHGVGLETYFALRNQLGSITDVQFYIDGVKYGDLYYNGTYDGQPDQAPYIYNYRAFGIQDLPDGEHLFQLQGGSPNLFELDYFTIFSDAQSDFIFGTTASTSAQPVTESPGQVSFSGMHSYTPSSTSTYGSKATGKSNAAVNRRGLFLPSLGVVVTMSSWLLSLA